jgi:hypothetical protein
MNYNKGHRIAQSPPTPVKNQSVLPNISLTAGVTPFKIVLTLYGGNVLGGIVKGETCMLFLSLLFMLAGMSAIGAAGVMITYTMITAGEKVKLKAPKDWPPDVKRWARLGACGLGSILLGMLAAMMAT